MTKEELDHLARAWIAYQHSWDVNRSSPETLGLEWANDSVDELLRDQPEDAWNLIRIIHRLDQSEPINQILSAHSFEDFMEVHGPAYIDRVKTEVENDPSFARIVSGVYKARIRDDIWDRLTAIIERHEETQLRNLILKRRVLRCVSRRLSGRTL